MRDRSGPVTPADVARHYDELDRFYRELWGEHLHHGLFESRRDDPGEAAVRMVSLVAELACLAPGQEVCDVGCGYGATARTLAEERGVRVTGITLSEAQARHARQATPPGAGLRFIQGDWLENDFADGSFDVVIAVESLAHMADRRRFFREAARVLRPGGRLVVCAWLEAEKVGRAGRRFLLDPICREGALPGMPTESECRRHLEESGFQGVRVDDLSRRVRRSWTVGARRLVGAVLRDRDYRQALRNRSLVNRRFALTVFRIRAAYALGVMRYGVFSARRSRYPGARGDGTDR